MLCAIRSTVAAGAALTLLATHAFAQQSTYDPRAPRPATQRSVQGTQQPAVQAPQPQIPQQQAAPFQLTPQQQAEVDNLLKAWEKQSNGVVTLKVTFTLFEYDPVFGPKNGPKRQAPGEIRYVAPDKGSYKVEGEQGEHWVCDGRAVYEYDAQKQQVIERPLPPEMQGKAIVDGPMPFMFGATAEKLRQRYFIRLMPHNVDGQVKLEAYPRYRQDLENFRMIEILLNTGAMMPYAVKMHLPNNKSHTVYVFDQPSVNNPIDRLTKGWIVAPDLPRGWQWVKMPAAPVQAQGTPQPRR